MEYAKRIDIFKGFLTVQMIFAHCIQFYTDLEKNTVALHLSEYINLTTFSGFLFCFGYASYLAYFRKERREASRRLLGNAGKMLTAYYISCFCYAIFVEKLPLRADKAGELLTLKRLAGWSEFLFSFALVMIMELLLFPLFTEKKKWGIPTVMAAAVFVCFLPHREVGSVVGSLIGGYGGTFFPVIPYSVYLAAGVWFARKKTGFRKSIFAVALAGTAWHVIDYIWISGRQPSRFPLSFSYLVGAAFFLYLYYLLAVALEEKTDVLFVRCFINAGRNSLFYLLVSNLIIFSVKASVFHRKSMLYSLGLFFIILMVVGYLKQIVRGDGRKRSNVLKS